MHLLLAHRHIFSLPLSAFRLPSVLAVIILCHWWLRHHLAKCFPGRFPVVNSISHTVRFPCSSPRFGGAKILRRQQRIRFHLWGSHSDAPLWSLKLKITNWILEYFSPNGKRLPSLTAFPITFYRYLANSLILRPLQDNLEQTAESSLLVQNPSNHC